MAYPSYLMVQPRMIAGGVRDRRARAIRHEARCVPSPLRVTVPVLSLQLVDGGHAVAGGTQWRGDLPRPLHLDAENLELVPALVSVGVHVPRNIGRPITACGICR